MLSRLFFLLYKVKVEGDDVIRVGSYVRVLKFSYPAHQRINLNFLKKWQPILTKNFCYIRCFLQEKVN